MEQSNEIVLITGGSGCLGQHIIKLLIQEKYSLGIKEIRSVDLKPYRNLIGHPESEDLKTYVGDICKPETIESAFDGVDCVFHCAANISFEFPANYDALTGVNYFGTTNVIDMCIKYNIRRLIYSSCASINFVPYMGHSTFMIVINQTETKATVPITDATSDPVAYDKQFFMPGYASSKLRAERLVLNTNGQLLKNGQGCLNTIALRFPLMYGEGDNHFLPPLYEYLSKRNFTIPRVGGAGGKHQLVYAGNVAWGHLCAYKTLKESPKKIAGLPAFITDDTPINDICRFVQRISQESETVTVNKTWWYIPHFLFFFMAFIVETFVKILNPIFGTKLKYSLRAIAAYAASVMMFNRIRASIHMDYDPKYDDRKSMSASGVWYGRWLKENLPKKVKGN